MFDFAHLFIGSALAQDATTSQTMADSGSALMRFLPLFLILGVFYFLLIRPQQKKLDAQVSMHKALKKGDRVLTGAGFVGTITKIESDDYLMVEIAEGVQVKVARPSISGLADAAFEKTAKAEKSDNKKK